jgi:hypothetical protein
MCDALWKDGFVYIEFLFDILILIWLPESWQEITLHQRLIFTGNFLWGDAIDTKCVISNTD